MISGAPCAPVRVAAAARATLGTCFVVMARAVPRDVFPLPSLPLPPLTARSRKRRQVEEKQRANVRACSEDVWSLNALSGRGQDFEGLRTSAAQRHSLDFIGEACRRDAPARDAPAPEAALEELLGSKASVCDTGGLSNVAPFQRDVISWPRQA